MRYSDKLDWMPTFGEAFKAIREHLEIIPADIARTAAAKFPEKFPDSKWRSLADYISKVERNDPDLQNPALDRLEHLAAGLKIDVVEFMRLITIARDDPKKLQVVTSRVTEIGKTGPTPSGGAPDATHELENIGLSGSATDAEILIRLGLAVARAGEALRNHATVRSSDEGTPRRRRTDFVVRGTNPPDVQRVDDES